MKRPARAALPAELPATTAPALSVLAGTARTAKAEPGPGPAGALLSHRRASSGPPGTTAAEPFPGVRFRRCPLPPRSLRRGAEGKRSARRCALVRPGAAPVAGVGPPRQSRLAIVVTGVPWRTDWRYRKPRLPTSTGTLAPCSPSCRPAVRRRPQSRLITRFPDATLDSLVGADGVHEFSLAVVSLGSADPALEPSGEAAVGAIDGAPLDSAHLRQHAFRAPARGRPWSRRQWSPGHQERSSRVCSKLTASDGCVARPASRC